MASVVNYYHGKIYNKVLERDDYKCVLCNSVEKVCVDHIVPVKKGGDNSLENQRTLCWSCHSKITNYKSWEDLSPSGKIQRQWRSRHPDYMKLYHREWRKRHKGYGNRSSEESKKLYAIYVNA